jgi:putative ABC transport system permease protein
MLSIKTQITEALKHLAASKMRSFLAVLGILVGTASVVAMVSIGKLAENQILSQFKALGINLLSVSIYPKGESSNPFDALSLNNAITLKQASKNIENVAPYISNYGSITYDGHTLSGSSVGATPIIYKIAKLYQASGRPLSYLDHNDYFCVIGSTIAQQIKARGVMNPIGKQIRVGSNYFTIVGTLHKWVVNFFFNTNFNTAILIPISTTMHINKTAVIRSVALKIKDTSIMQSTENEIKAYVAKHSIKQRVDVRSPKSLVDSMKKSSQTMTLLLGLIGSISLIVGGIGVMNIMLVSVAERHKEIGIRLAIGAKQRDIQMQFLVESITLSIFGGVTGMILGIVSTYFVALYSKWTFSLFLMPPLVGCFVSIMVGVFFGFYPAMKASKLDPIQTLRSD